MVAEIPLTHGLVALVDDEDFGWLAEWSWHSIYTPHGRYAARSSGTKTFLMHREILGIKDRKIRVDHQNQNRLDNQRGNLRVATPTQNAFNSKIRSDNTSGYRGVSYAKSRGVWTARIKLNGVYKNLGYFPTPELAASAYDKAAMSHYPEFAVSNITPMEVV